MTLVLYCISHLGQSLPLFMARAGLDILSPAKHFQRSRLGMDRAGAARLTLQPSLHRAVLQQLTALCSLLH